MKNTKKGLVFGGGGSKGSYSVGVCRLLEELNQSYEVVTGTSIGALTGALYASGQIHQLEKWVESFNKDMVSRNLFEFPFRNRIETLKPDEMDAFIASFGMDGPSISPLRQNYGKIFDYQAFQASPIDFGVMTWNVTQSQPRSFVKSQMSEDNVLDIICASAAYFPAFNFVEIDSEWYADGGYAHTIPWQLAKEMGAEELTIISLQDPGEEESLPETLPHHFFRPLIKLSYFLDFEASVMDRQIQQGYLEALKYMDMAPGYLYTFYMEDWPLILSAQKQTESLLEKQGLQISDAMAHSILQGLLGYKPWPLDNGLMKDYHSALFLEALALTAGINPYVQYHFCDFIDLLLERLKDMKADLNLPVSAALFADMQKAGIQDLMFFFYSGCKSFQGNLPKAFEVFKKKFFLPYCLGVAWYILDVFSPFFAKDKPKT